MLNNLTNFLNIITSKMIKKVPEATDLIPLGTRDSRYGGKYKPTGITVADFIDSIPIPVFNSTAFKKLNRGINVVNSTAIVSSTSFRIPANTITADTLLEFLMTGIRVTGNNARMQFVLLHNTVNSVSGAAFLAQFIDLPVGNYHSHNTRSVLLDYSSNQLKTFETTNTISTDFGRTSTPVTLSINFAVDNYIIVAVKNDSLLDTSRIDYAQITSNNLIS